MREALIVIRREHRSLAAVLHALKFVCDEIAAGRMKPDFKLLWAMLHYIDAFPERLHHPKEDRYLFAALRKRTTEAAPALARLEREHKECPALINRLIGELLRYKNDPSQGIADFAKEAERFSDFHWRHMRVEEDIIIPLAEKAFAEEDWRSIDQAFQDNSDPLIGIEAQKEFDKLFTRIVNLAPAPIGVGAR
jgi:hemerythrin-like domain-containing protein